MYLHLILISSIMSIIDICISCYTNIVILLCLIFSIHSTNDPFLAMSFCCHIPVRVFPFPHSAMLFYLVYNVIPKVALFILLFHHLYCAILTYLSSVSLLCQSHMMSTILMFTTLVYSGLGVCSFPCFWHVIPIVPYAFLSSYCAILVSILFDPLSWWCFGCVRLVFCLFIFAQFCSL